MVQILSLQVSPTFSDIFAWKYKGTLVCIISANLSTDIGCFPCNRCAYFCELAYLINEANNNRYIMEFLGDFIFGLHIKFVKNIFG